ncbi:MAG TPA: glycosyltransferase [Candidatus Dormibacteraeota bacterium]|nr:glycosyltransferase [Candidatus Dormibacteraeota bacterium]
MLTDLLFAPVFLAYAAILVLLFVYGANFVHLTLAALRMHDRRGDAPIPSRWPAVTVQLPIYNEVYVARRLIDAVARMDYPAELLQVQVLDDSTDETVAIVAAAAAEWRARGIDVVQVRRPGRAGFKAGALRHGMQTVRGEFIAIFDADFVPRPDFLRQALPRLVADPGLAFVQARWGHVNRGYSLLTRLQALAIDGHFAIEQAARWSTGKWFNFNGTAGIWRRSAVVDAGGWQNDTLTEDLDLSYRAFRAGWRAEYLPLVEAPAELPVSFSAYRRQQHRWARGSFECAIKHLPAIWASPVPLSRKVAATLHLTGYGIHLLLLALSVLFPILLLESGPHPALFALVGTLGIFNLTSLAPTVLFAAGQRQLGRRWLLQIPAILLLSPFGSGMMVNTGRAAWQALRGRAGEFERTPKFGVRDRGQDWHRLRYQLGVDRIVIGEVALALVNLLTCVVAIQRGYWAIVVYAAIFALGLLSAVAATVRQSFPLGRPLAVEQPA